MYLLSKQFFNVKLKNIVDQSILVNVKKKSKCELMYRKLSWEIKRTKLAWFNNYEIR